MKKTIIELFAGVGGFRLGFENQSKEWETVWANQWEPGRKTQHAYDCYISNFGNSMFHSNTDIAEVDTKDIPEGNLLVGGFPCQDYSVARSLSNNSGIQGKKGVLWWEIHRILKEKDIPFVLLENVDRLLKSPAKQRGRDYGIMLQSLNQLGYGVEWRVINAADYGMVQRRRRVFIFAFKNSTNYYKNMNKTELETILLDDGLFAQSFPIETELNNSKELTITGDLIELTKNFKFNFENSGIMINGNLFTAKTTPIYKTPKTLRSVLESNVDEKYYVTKNLDKWEYLKGSKKINRTSADGHEYVYSEGGIAFPDPIDAPARTMLTSESSINRSSHIIEDPETNRLRIITPIEAERIQGFKDNWTNTGMPEKFRYFCMGNALVVPVVEKLAGDINNIFEKE